MLGWGRKKSLGDYVEPEYSDLLQEIKDRFQFAAEAEQKQRELELDDYTFCDPNSQWDAAIRSSREDEGRPCLTVDRLGPFIHQIVNEQRQNRPQPQVNPVGDGADKETAEIEQGVVRHIMYQSNGDTAIDTAFEAMVRGGRGFMRVLTEYSDPEGFEQDIRVARVPNPFTVYLDPSYTEADASDMEWAFVVTDVPLSVYRAQFPDSKMATMDASDFESIGDAAPEWARKDGSAVRVVEYFKRVRKLKKLAQLEDGIVVEASKVPQGITPVATRDSMVPTVLWFKANAIEVLDKTEWPGRYIPIIPVFGTELTIDGKRTYSGLVRSAKDAQRAYNYWKSAQAETIALAPRAPWVAPRGALGNMRHVWQQANKRSVSVLEYEAFDDQNRALPPPQRVVQEPPIMAITNAMIGAVDDLKATTGIYDPSLGNREANQSGVAIRQLQRQGSMGNFHYQDNLARAVRYLGRVIIDVIPKVIDTERVVRIIQPDETVELVKVNAPTVDKKGLERIYRMDVGKYDVTVSVGPAYQTRRQENLVLLESLMQGPLGAVLAQVAPDLVVSMMDFQIAPKLIERMKKILPPNLQEEGPDAAVPAAIQQQMQESQQMIEQLTQALQAAQDQIEQKAVENQTKMDIAKLQAETDLEKTRAQVAVEMAKIQAQMEMGSAELTLKAQMAELDALQAAMQQQTSETQPSAAPGGEGQGIPAEAAMTAAPQPTTPAPSPEMPMGAPGEVGNPAEMPRNDWMEG